MYKNDVSLEKGSSSLKYNRALFGNVTRSRRLGGSASESSTSVVDDSCLRSVIGVYPPDFERVRSEAYGALDVLRSLGVDVDTCTSDISSSATVSSSVHVYDEKSVQNMVLEHRLEELSASLGRDSNLARILLKKLSNHASLDPSEVSSALKIVSRGRGQKSIVYEGPRNDSGGRLLLQVVNHELPDEMYWLSLNGSVGAVHGVGMAFAGYFLGPTSSDLAMLSPAMRHERIDMSYRIDDRWLTVRSPDGSEVRALGSIDRAFSRREKLETVLRGEVS